MGMMIDGVWHEESYRSDEKGRFLRDATKFRERPDSPPAAGRYHLYVSYACPWAHRTLIMRKLKGLEEVVTLSVVDPYMGSDGWYFSDRGTPDPIHGAHFLYEVYRAAVPRYTGRVTVPILWDRERGTILNNESRQIIRMFDHDFGGTGTDFCPPDLQERVDATLDAIYDPINNGVYRAGFAFTQEAYDEAIDTLYAALDHWEGVLGGQRFLCGDRLTEADWAMFTTLFRFDPVYSVHFKCSRKRLVDYPHLSRYMRELYEVPGVADTCRLDHIREHYYRSHPFLNPRGIMAAQPVRDFLQS